MRTKLIVGTIAFIFSGLTNTLAADDPLTKDQAQRFIASLYDVDALRESSGTAGDPVIDIDTKPTPGKAFSPYGNIVSLTQKDHKPLYSKLAATIKPHGFAPAEWGAVGDRLMIATMAIKLEQENPDAISQLKNMDPSMLALLPAAQRTQIEQAKMIATMAEAAPAADKAIAKLVAPEMDKYMDQQN